MSDNDRYQEWTRFGWQGLRLIVPREWHLASTQGDRKKGYLSLIDEATVRMEMRWEEVRRESNVGVVVSDYIASLRKKAKRKKADIEITRRINAASFPEDERTWECYSWRSDMRAVAMVTQCTECNRVVHIQVLGEPDEKLRSTARTIFCSLQDHSEDELETWAFYDVCFDVPSDFRLVTADLRTGCINLRFERGRERLHFARLSLAHVVLQSREMDDWVREHLRKTLRFYKTSPETGIAKGHEALGLAGRAKRPNDLLGLFRGSRRLRVITWLCDINDRVLMLGLESRKATDEKFAELVARVRCHEAEDTGATG